MVGREWRRDEEIELLVMPSGRIQIVGSGIANEGQEIKETTQVKARDRLPLVTKGNVGGKKENYPTERYLYSGCRHLGCDTVYSWWSIPTSEAYAASLFRTQAAQARNSLQKFTAMET